jgi:Type II secretion system (T2SS), protein M subtype b
MSQELRRSVQRWFAIALLGMLLVSIWSGMIAPVVDYLDTAALSRGISLRALKRNRALVRQADAIIEARRSVDQSTRWRNFYEGSKPESATIQLEADIRTILREANGPTSMSAEPAIVRGPVTRIAVRVNLSMRVDQLAEALDRIQKNARQLRIESLTVQAPDFQGTQTNPPVTVQAEVSALMLTQAIPPGAAT